MDIVFHYPPELFQLLVDTIPLLCRSKNDVLLFFQGAAVPSHLLDGVRSKVAQDRQAVSKYEIVRVVLRQLNEGGESRLRERREVLRRVVQFEDFSTCWANDQLKAKGLVAEIRRVVNVKDSFTRMNEERERENLERKRRAETEHRKVVERRAALDSVRQDLGALFGIVDPAQRGTRLEAVLNRLFRTYGISVREAFRIVEEKAPGVLEQVDGVVELDGELYLVEMKWLSEPVGVEDVSRHLVRIYHRGSSRGLFISMTEFTGAALKTCTDALQHKVVTLCLLEEIVHLLEQEGELTSLLRQKVQAAIIERKPFVRVHLKVPTA